MTLAGRPVLVIFTRRPELGQVKSRLVPLVGVEGALRLHRAFIEDTLSNLASAAKRLGMAVVLAVTGSCELDPADVPGGTVDRVIGQVEGDLGARLSDAQRRMFAAGATAFLAVGSDSPTLPVSILTAALDRLTQVEAVFSPAEDGGYVLVGLSRPQSVLFERIPWGTSKVLKVSLRRASQARISSFCLPGWYDVDAAPGLLRLRREMREPAWRASATAAALSAVPESSDPRGHNSAPGRKP